MPAMRPNCRCRRIGRLPPYRPTWRWSPLMSRCVTKRAASLAICRPRILLFMITASLRRSTYSLTTRCRWMARAIGLRWQRIAQYQRYTTTCRATKTMILKQDGPWMLHGFGLSKELDTVGSVHLHRTRPAHTMQPWRWTLMGRPSLPTNTPFVPKAHRQDISPALMEIAIDTFWMQAPAPQWQRGLQSDIPCGAPLYAC
jgi:hypothetical protein